DAQAGAETAMGALLAVESGLDSVSGVGMLDYLLTFSIPKLVIDDEIVGQVLHFQGEVAEAGDIPTSAIIEEMFEEGHALVADHTMANWQTAMYLPGPVWDRDARDAWTSKGELDVNARAVAEVERLLDSYEMPDADPALDAEARAIIRSGQTRDEELPKA
ncbi:MAG: trimethylamine methyltransferase family protein, partial [Candidatus Limnocylindrales bacterium]